VRKTHKVVTSQEMIV